MSNYRFRRVSPARARPSAAEYEQHLEDEWQQSEAQMSQAAYERRLELMKPHEGLRRLRNKLDITQEEIASVCGVTKRSYQFYEAGQKAIPSTVIAKLSAMYLIDIHKLFTGAAHSDNVDVRAETAHFAAEVVTYLASEFPAMSSNERQHIAMAFVSKNRPGATVDLDNLFECIRIVTGDMYLTYELSSSGIAGLPHEDSEAEQT